MSDGGTVDPSAGAGPLQVLTEDASLCCRRAWRRAVLVGLGDQWECPTCGCAYAPRAVEGGAMVVWEAKAWAVIF